MINLNKLPKHVALFMPRHQKAIVSHPDSYQEFVGEIKRLETEIAGIPDSPREQSDVQGSMYDKLTVYAHFFYAGCDWFILSWDRENDILFCYAILNQDVEMSELGTTYLSDLTGHGRIELDFYWEKCSLAQALYDKYPEDFTEPCKAIIPSLEKLSGKKRKQQNIKLHRKSQKLKNWKSKIKKKYAATRLKTNNLFIQRSKSKGKAKANR